MRQVAIAFAAVVPSIWFINAMTTPTSTPIVAKAVPTEGLRAARQDGFSMRWSNVALMPPTKETIYEPLLLVSQEAPLVSHETQPIRRVRAASLHRLDVCARHHMRRVITRGGRSWRCR